MKMIRDTQKQSIACQRKNRQMFNLSLDQFSYVVNTSDFIRAVAGELFYRREWMIPV